MLSTNNIESELSYAYLHAVASRAGFICKLTNRHEDDAGIDAQIRVIGELAPDSILTNFSIDVQLKATKKKQIFSKGRYSYPLKLKNYNELRSVRTGAPQILIVMYLPDDETKWLDHSESRLTAKKCAYWQSLRLAPDTTNESHETVYFPKANALSVKGLVDLMTRFSKREEINYVP